MDSNIILSSVLALQFFAPFLGTSTTPDETFCAITFFYSPVWMKETSLISTAFLGTQIFLNFYTFFLWTRSSKFYLYFELFSFQETMIFFTLKHGAFTNLNSPVKGNFNHLP
jgi:hypothetical protein